MKQNPLANFRHKDFAIKSNELCDIINQFRAEEGRNKKRHSDFLRIIRDEFDILKKLGITKSTYKDKQNQERRCYILNYECIEYLKNISKHDIKAYCYILDEIIGNKTNIVTLPATTVRKELLINKILLAWFNEEQIKTQYPVLNYRLDYYIPNCFLIIEYDEASGHKDIEADNKRMDEILNYLIEEWLNNPNSDGYDVDHYIENNLKPTDHFTVIRIKEYEEEKGLNELFEFLTGDVGVYSKLENLNR